MFAHKLVPHLPSQRALAHVAKPLSFHIYMFMHVANSILY
jgi:hypothetical protein